MNLIGRQTQKCPRCGAKSLINQHKCPDCGLVFAKLEMATNKEAAKRYKAHEREAIILTRRLPSDIKWWKLILITLFLGLFGGHYFYTRRWWWGLVYLFGSLILISCVVFNAYFMSTQWGTTLVDVLAFFIGIYGLCWLFDIVKVCSKRFKVPVSLPDKQNAKVEEKA